MQSLQRPAGCEWKPSSPWAFSLTARQAQQQAAPSLSCGPVSSRDGFAIGGLPSPSARAIAARDHAVLVDLGNDVTVARQQGLGRAHLCAQRQLAFGQPIGAILLVLYRRPVRLWSAGAVSAFVHLAARAEIADAWILRRAERAGVEAIATADAEVLGVQHDGVGGGVEAAHRTHRRTRRVGAMHAGHRHRSLTRPAVVDGDDAPPIDTPRHFVLVLACGDAGVAVDASISVAEKLHPRHFRLLMPP